MPDENKMQVFKDTNMTIFKSCILCKHGEVPPSNDWGICKHPGHFYTHARHGRLPGPAHSSMGCNDHEMLNPASRKMVELGPYLELIPMHDDKVEEVGAEEVEVDGKKGGSEEIKEILKKEASKDVLQRFEDQPEETKPVNMHFNGSPKPDPVVVEFVPEDEKSEQETVDDVSDEDTGVSKLDEMGAADTEPDH